ncbi:MAG: hypothetical protein RLO80_06160 [Hyphomonas sp.]
MSVRVLLAPLLAVVILSAPAHADETATNPTDAVYACASVTEDAARLACFDSAVTALRTKEEAGLVQTIDVARIETIEKEAFGFSMPSLPNLFSRQSASGDKITRDEVEEITVGVKSARIQGVTGRALLVLDNGQTWEQTDTAKVPASTLRKAKEVRIRKAALGSYMITVDGGRSFRVKRTS